MLDFIPSFGRLENPDERDALFPVSAVLPEADPFVTEKYWWDGGWWGNQGAASHCVAYSWMHFIADGPVVQEGMPAPLFTPAQFYHECQLRDPWPGTNYPGTSVRTAAKVLQELGVIGEYRWAENSEEVAQTILNLGPMVAGTKWYADMAGPKPNGVVRPTGSSLGGHAYLLNGVDTKKKMFRIKNSWGRDWGKEGYAFITFRDFDSLLDNGGEICIAFEKKVDAVPSFATLSPPTSG